MKHMPPSNPSNEDTRRRAAKRNAVKLWIGFICICVVIGVFGTLKLSKGKLDEAENQENAVAANECLNQAFGQTANGSIIFPEDYAGAYINGGHLVLLLTNTSEEATEKYRNWAGEYSSCLTFKKVKYSYNELSEKLDPIVEKLKEDGYEVTSSAVSETENAVSIGLFKCESAEASKLAKNLSETFGVRVLVSEVIYTTECVETE